MQLRKDPVTSRWVIVNVEKPRETSAYSAEPHPKSTKVCPFCPGNESMTPPEIAAYGRKMGNKNGPGWQLRVVPNKFPALRIEENTDKLAIGVYDKLGGFGAHEVIVENPDHNREIADLGQTEVELILKAYRDRCLDLAKDTRFKYILIFKNFGSSAGASLEHPHSQLIALPVVPSRVLGELKGAQKHFEYTDRCIFCDMLNQETTEKQYRVLDENGFVAFTPFASRFPFETWVMPKNHEAVFEASSDARLAALAALLLKTLQKLKNALSNPSYNLMIHSLPIGGRELDSFHWHIEIIPHLTQVSGFELGTGFYINPTPAELCAESLRHTPPF